MRLGIDLDGVVANFTAGWIGFYNEQFGTHLHEDDVDGWGVIPHLTHFHSMHHFWEWARHLDGASLFRHLDTYPGAVETLWELRWSGHDIVIITTKPGWAIHDTFAWISEQRLPTREVHITRDKWEIDCHLYLDDSPGQLRNYLRHRPDRGVVRYVRRWNSPIEGAIDVDDWSGFRDLVRGHEKRDSIE